MNTQIKAIVNGRFITDRHINDALKGDYQQRVNLFFSCPVEKREELKAIFDKADEQRTIERKRQAKLRAEQELNELIKHYANHTNEQLQKAYYSSFTYIYEYTRSGKEKQAHPTHESRRIEQVAQSRGLTLIPA